MSKFCFIILYLGQIKIKVPFHSIAEKRQKKMEDISSNLVFLSNEKRVKKN